MVKIKIAQAKHLYTVSSATMAKIEDMVCRRCGKGFDIGQRVLSRAKKAHSKYGVYHESCALEVNLLP